MDKDFLEFLKEYAGNLEDGGRDSEILFDFLNDLSEHMGYKGKIEPTYIYENVADDLEFLGEEPLPEGSDGLALYIEYLEEQLQTKDRIIDALLNQVEENI